MNENYMLMLVLISALPMAYGIAILRNCIIAWIKNEPFKKIIKIAIDTLFLDEYEFAHKYNKKEKDND